MKFKETSYIVALVLASCSPTFMLQSHDADVVKVQAEIDSTIINIITPYQDAIEDQMNEVLTYTKNNLYKGRPESTIGNFVTDLCLNYTQAHMCVMNNGGLRTNISKGEITRGKLYELMPFENELVVLELNKNDFIGFGDPKFKSDENIKTAKIKPFIIQCSTKLDKEEQCHPLNLFKLFLL